MGDRVRVRGESSCRSPSRTLPLPQEAKAKAAEEAAAKAAEEAAAAAAAEEEDEGADDWENVADEWDAEGSDIEIPDIGGGDESDEDEDLVEKERRLAEAELKKKGEQMAPLDKF